MTLIPTSKYFTFVTDKSSITNSNLMISAGRFCYGDRQFILAQRLHGKYSDKTKLLFEEGNRKHEMMQAPYKNLEEIGYMNYRKLLYQHKKISIKELKVLSKVEYMFGIIDLFEIEFTKDGILNIWITEFKSSKWKTGKHFLQLTVYALICGDLTAKLVLNVPYKRPRNDNKKKSTIGYLYPELKLIKKINIKGKVHLTDETLYQPFEEIVVDNEFTYAYSNRRKCLENRRRKFWEYILKGFVEIENVKYCKGCEANKKSNYCGWVEECNKYPYNPRLNQMKFGKVKMLVKN